MWCSGARACWPCVAAAAVLLATARAGAEEGVLAELPFLDEVPWLGKVEDGHIAVDLSPLESRPFVLLLDTGAEHSMLTPRYARDLGVVVSGSRDRPVRRATRLGHYLEFWVDTSSSDTGARRFEIGLLGGNFLERYVVEVDYQARRVRFLDPESRGVSEATAEPGEIVVPMRLTNRRPAVEIALGSGSAWFLMDTGAPSDLVLSEERARALGIEFDPVASVTFRNLYGDARAALTRLERVEVGGHAIDGPTLAVALREGSSYRVTNVAGADQALLGNAFLRRFRVRFDYPNRRVGLLPLASPPPSGDAEPLQASLAPAPGEVVPELELPEVASLEPARALVPTEEVFLEVKAPEAGVREEFVPWVEVEGWAGVHRSRAYDVAIVIDTSGSTAWASGIDVDGDGRVGRGRRRVDLWRSFNPRHMCSDPGDTVLAAELVATRRLVDALDPERTRIGLVTFSDGSRLNASVGSDRETFSELLDQLGEGFGSGYTNFAAAIRLATEALVAASEGEPDAPQRVILFLSDGYPTFPGSEERAAREALEAAREAAASSVRIHTFGLGLADDPNAPESEDEDAFVQMAALTGGSHLRLDTPGEVVQELPRIDLAEVAGVEIVNATSGQSARATRVFPDGSFDAFVSLVPGENVIRVTARGARGGVARAERRIVFDRREPATPEEAAALAARVRELEVELRARAVETELYLQMGRQRQQKALELELEPPAGDP